MRDEYIGDVGDFGKYILLNKLSELCGSNGKIGINWYYNTRPKGAFNYFSDDLFKPLSETLFEALAKVVEMDKMKMSAIEKDVLSEKFFFYREPIPSPISIKKRAGARIQWFEKSKSYLSKADIVFLDPDNGTPYYSKVDEEWTPHVRVTNVDSLKYVYMHEIKQYYNTGKSVIVYNHRDFKPEKEFREKFVILKRFVGLQSSMPVLRFKKFQVRDYLLIPQKGHDGLFRNLAATLTLKPFDFLFDRYEIN